MYGDYMFYVSDACEFEKEKWRTEAIFFQIE